MPPSPASDIPGHPSGDRRPQIGRPPVTSRAHGRRPPGPRRPFRHPGRHSPVRPPASFIAYIPNRIWYTSRARSYAPPSPGQSGAIRPGVDRWSPVSAPARGGGSYPPPRGDISVQSSGAVHHLKTPSNLRDAPVRPDNDPAGLLWTPRSIWPTVIRRTTTVSPLYHPHPPPTASPFMTYRQF